MCVAVGCQKEKAYKNTAMTKWSDCIFFKKEWSNCQY